MIEPRSRPIIFSASMVRAILAGHKSQTRRIVKQLIGAHHVEDVYHRPDGRFIGLHGPVGVGCGITNPFSCPYGLPGDQLWVRENWRPVPEHLSECTGPGDIRFAASVSEAEWATSKWRPSIHMPRWASRISLRITDIRIGRLNDISPEDAAAEGWPGPDERDSIRSSYPIAWYAGLWEQINGADSWAANPWVWTINFETVKAN